MKLLFIPVLLLLFFTGNLKLLAQNYVGSGISLKYPGGSGNYVDLGDVYNNVNFPFTIEAWINPASTVPNNPVFITDNNYNDYHGIELRIDNGVIFFSMGDGSGDSESDRRGVYGTTTIQTNRWTHLACVAENASTWLVYINGVKDITVTTGSTSATNLVWSTYSAYIGREHNYWDDIFWKGGMDEIRFWNIARTQTEIRDYMCRKIDPSATGLIGYWIADESYSGSGVNDQTVPAENGTINGTVTKVTSGAPIGDTSTYTYPSGWNGVTVSLGEISGDLFTAGNVTGSPYGIQVYLVDSLPHDTLGLDTVPKFYFGVFCAQSANTSNYDITYHYDFNNGVINLNNEYTAGLFRRDDGSVTSWSNTGATLDMINDELFKSIESKRGEYILDVKGYSSAAFSATDSIVCQKFCIDFFDQSTNNPTSWQWIFEGGNPPASTQQNPTQICYNLPGVYDVTLIASNANGSDTLFQHDLVTVLSTPAIPVITQNGYTLTSSYSSSYQWQFNTVNIPGATNQSYDVTQTGYYTVVISNEDDCVNSATVYVLISGVDEIAGENAFIFPNPAINQLHIDLSQFAEPVSSLRIADIAGKTLLEIKIEIGNQKMNLDVSKFSAGIYFVEAISASKKFCVKLEVQK